MLLERVAAGSREPDHLTDRDAPMIAGELNDLQLQIGHRSQHDLLTLHFFLQLLDLLGEGAQEERNPWLPVRHLGANRGLRLAKRQVISLLALLNHALQRAVGHIGVARLQQQKSGEHPGEPAIAILEGVDLQEHHHEDRNDQQRMQAVRFALLMQPIHQLHHQTGSIKR